MEHVVQWCGVLGSCIKLFVMSALDGYSLYHVMFVGQYVHGGRVCYGVGVLPL